MFSTTLTRVLKMNRDTVNCVNAFLLSDSLYRFIIARSVFQHIHIRGKFTCVFVIKWFITAIAYEEWDLMMLWVKDMRKNILDWAFNGILIWNLDENDFFKVIHLKHVEEFSWEILNILSLEKFYVEFIESSMIN